MNFSNTKKLRKILSLVIAMIMVTTTLTGCFGKDKEADPTDPPLSLPSATDPIETETQPVPTEPEEINENMATVLSQLNVRSAPTDQGTQLGILYPGDKVEVMQKQTTLGIEWGYITSPMSGWVCMDFVEMDYKPDDADDTDASGSETPSEPRPDEGEEENPIDKLDKDNPGAGSGNGSTNVIARGTVTASELNIRSGASTSSDSVGSLKRGTKVEILEKSGNWGRIKQGWISLQHVDLESSSNGGSNSSSKPSGGNGNTDVIARGIVTAKELNIRASAAQDSERLGSYKYGTRVEILEKSNGWGRTSKGWIALNYVYMDGAGTGDNRYGVVTASELNIRSGPGRDYGSVGSLKEGDKVTILFRLDTGDMTWGNIKQGWISLDYVDVEGGNDDDDDDNDGISWAGDDDDDEDVEFRGIVTANGLNVRKAPDADSDKVGTMNYGTRVAILEKDGNWGRTSKGWISLDYVYVDGSGDGGDYGTVSTGLNVRSGPGTNYDVVGSLDEGDEVEILFELEVGDSTWGNIKQGWISMAYVD